MPGARAVVGRTCDRSFPAAQGAPEARQRRTLVVSGRFTWNTRRRRVPRAWAEPAVVPAAADACGLGRFTWNIRSRSRAAAAPPYETGLTQRGHSAASQAGATQHQLPTRSPRPTTRPRSATDYTNLPIPYRLASGSRGGPCPRCPKLPVRPILPSVDAASRSHSNTGVPFHLRY